MTAIISDFESPPRRIYSPIRVCLALMSSSISAILLHGLLMILLEEGFAPERVLHQRTIAVGIAGLGIGIYTICYRRRNLKRESIFQCFISFYAGLFIYWYSFLFIEGITDLFSTETNSNVNLERSAVWFLIFVTYGTVFLGPLLFPLTFVIRWIVWSVHGSGTPLESSRDSH